MNTGIFGEGFPYSNFHDLNMDWIIKITKDFLDQYTHIQEVIENGEQSLLDKTADGLEQLQNKADNLENLLQEWYNTHSQDITDQLADALQDLNDWYTTHISMINTALNNALNTFDDESLAIANRNAQSIPADYSSLSQMVDNMSNYQLLSPETVINGAFISTGGVWFTASGYKVYVYRVNPNMSYMFTSCYGYDVRSFFFSRTATQGTNLQYTEQGEVSGTRVEKTYNKKAPTTSIYLLISTFEDFTPTVYLTSNNGYYQIAKLEDVLYTPSGSQWSAAFQTSFYEVLPNTVYNVIITYGLVAVGIVLFDESYNIIDRFFIDSNNFNPYVEMAIYTKPNTHYLGFTCNVPNPANLTENDYKIGLKQRTYTDYTAMKWAVLGDSLTEQNDRTSCSYYDYINAKLGMWYYKNFGYSGTSYANNTPWKNIIANISEDDNNFEVITLFGSGNDLSSGLPLGIYTDTGTSTIAGYVNDAITALFNKNPTCAIGIITPTPWTYYCNGNLSGQMETYSNLLISIAKYRGIPVLDLYHESNLRPWISDFRRVYYTHDTDGVHPSELGHVKFIAPHVMEFVKSLYPAKINIPNTEYQ